MSFVASDFSDESDCSSSRCSKHSIKEAETCNGLKVEHKRILVKAGTLEISNLNFKVKKEITIGTLDKKKTFLSRNQSQNIGPLFSTISPAIFQSNTMLPLITEKNFRTPSRIKLSPVGKDLFKQIAASASGNPIPLTDKVVVKDSKI